MTTIAIMVSGNGSNMEAICDHVINKDLEADIAFVASDNTDAPALEKAKRKNIRTVTLPYRTKGRKEAETLLCRLLEEGNVDWLILAGFMKLLSSAFVSEYRDRIVNIHPSLLPSFPGTTGIEDAWNYGVKLTGVTVHLVDEKMDNGPILAQEPVRIEKEDTLSSLTEKVHRTEHELYWKTLSSLFRGKLEYVDRRSR